MSALRSLPAVISGAGALGLVVAVLAGAAGAPATRGGASAGTTALTSGAGPTVAVAVAGGQTTLVCPSVTSGRAVGLELPPAGRGSLVATALTTRAVAAPRAAATAPSRPSALVSATPLATPTSSSGVALGSALTVTVPGTSGGVLTAPPTDGGAPLLAGSVLASASSGDLRGLSSPGCLAPAQDSWLVGGTLATGRSVRLVVADPGLTPATVDVTVLTSTGPQQPASLQNLSLAPGERRSVLLEGVVTGSGPLAVRVRSSAGGVSAWLDEQVVRGLVSGGTDVVVPAAAPGRELVVSGLVTSASQGTPFLRLAAPGTSPVIARYGVLAAAGSPSAVGTATVAVQPGQVVDVPLAGLPAGAGAVAISSDQPLVAALGLDTAPVGGSAGSAGEGDVAWSAAEPALGAPTLVALPRAASASSTSSAGPTSPASSSPATPPVASLVLAAGGRAGSLDVSVVAADGSITKAQGVSLTAGSAATLAVASLPGGSGAPLGLLLSPSGTGAGLRAALALEVEPSAGSAAGDLLSVRPIVAPVAAVGSVSVSLSGAP